MLMFLRCDDDYISSLNSILDGKAMVYHHPGTQIPAPIPDEEMDMFIMLTSSMEDGFEQIPYDGNLVKNAEKYRVTGGEYAGVVGYYRRIKKNKRLVIPFEGFLMLVATNYIPKCYLQEVVL
jgi:transcriptional antiterminator RfaH